MFLKPHKGGYMLSVRVMPNARHNGIEGIWNETFVKIALSAPAVDGKANEALISLIADRLHIRKSAVSLISGIKSREKRLGIHGELPSETVAAFEEEIRATCQSGKALY